MASHTKLVVLTFDGRTVLQDKTPNDALAWMLRHVNVLANLRLNQALTDGGVGIATNKARARNTASITFQVDGEFRTPKASTDDLFVLAGEVPPSSIGAWLLCLDSTGAGSTVAVPAVLGADASKLVWPLPPDGKVIVGWLTVATNASTTFTGGTTLLDAAGLTVVYGDGVPKYLLPNLVAIQ